MNAFGTSCWTPQNKVNNKATKWQFEIRDPDKLDILYIFNQYNIIKGSYNVRITVGSLPEFYLGIINNNNPSLQSEPNFPIQRGTKCCVTIQQQINQIVTNPKPKIVIDQKKIQQLKQSTVVHSFNEKFDHFMDALSSEWSQVFMTEVQKNINEGKLDQNREIDKGKMYELIKHLHQHIQSSKVNTQFQTAIKNVINKEQQYSKKT